MPFKSPQQRKYLFAKKPEVAKKFVAYSRTLPDGPIKGESVVRKTKTRMSEGGKMKY